MEFCKLEILYGTPGTKKAVANRLHQQQQQYDVGLIAITGLQEAKANYDLIVANEIAARNNLATAVEQLRTITNRTYPDLYGANSQLPLVMPNPADIEQWICTAERQNYTLQATVQAANAAQVNITTQRAGHLPVINGIGTYSYDRESNGAQLGFTMQRIAAVGFNVNFHHISRWFSNGSN